MFLLLLATVAAQEAGHYSPDSVAGKSATFVRFAEALGPKGEALDQQMAVAGSSIHELDLGVDLLGERAPEDLRAWRLAQRKAYAQQGLQARAFSDWIQDASGQVFGSALDIAVEEYGAPLEVCAARSGMAAIAMGPMAGGGGSCPGQDLSAQLAESMDANAELTAVVDELLAESWPTVKLDEAQQAAVPFAGEDGYVRLAVLAEALMGARIEALEEGLDRDLSSLDRALAQGGAEAEDALKEAEARRLRHEADLAKEGERLLGAIEKPLSKSGLSVALCANPPAMGGCSGQDRTKEVVEALRDDKKVKKALE